MSVKIYDGMMMERDLSLAELRDLAKKARPKLDKMVEQAQVAAVARVAISVHDRALMGSGLNAPEGEDKPRSPLGAGFHYLQKQRDDDKKGLRTDLSMGLEACFMAIGGGKTLVMGFGAGELVKEFARLIGAKEHGYWDNSDEPDGMGKAQWSQRKRDWQKALGKGFEMAPSEAGVSAQLVASKYASWWTPEVDGLLEWMGSQPGSARARAARLAEDVCRELYLAKSETFQKFKAESSASHSLSGFIEAMGEWRDAAMGEAKPMLDLATDLLEAGLPAIDEAALRARPEDLAKSGAALKAMLHDRLALMELEASALPAAPKRGI